MTEISWNKENFTAFKKKYKNAVATNISQFNFEGNEFVVGYAKYLIQYLEQLLK